MTTKTKRRYIKISVQDGENTLFKRVLAEPVVIKGFEKFDFAVHKHLTDRNRFNVTHIQTGRAVSDRPYYLTESYQTKEAAISAATFLLKKKGKRILQSQIDKHLIEVQ